MYYRFIESDAAAKQRYNEASRKAAVDRMKVVNKKKHAIRRAKKSLA
jgi:hypothetical protein